MEVGVLYRDHGEGVLGVEQICPVCNEFIDMDYSYHEHCWRGFCWQCLVHLLVDLERVIGDAKYGPYNDWDAGLLELKDA